jgi:MFS family permease
MLRRSAVRSARKRHRPRRHSGRSSLHSLSRSLWSNRAFRGLLLAHFASNFGDWLAFIALFNLVALQWRVDVLGIGLLTASYLLPFALIAPFAGVFVDRWELRRLLIASDVLRCGIVCLMLWANDLAVLCGLIFLHQSVSTFFNPAQHAAIPRLVERSHLLAANAWSTQASHATKVLGPGVAGVLVAALGTRGCLLIDAATFLVSAGLLLALPRLPAPVAERPSASVSGDLRAALRWLRQDRRLRIVLASLLLSIAGLGAFLVSLPVHVRDVLQLGPRGMGALLSALGAGTLLGAAALLSLGGRDRPRLLRIGGIVLGIGLAGFALTTQAVTAAALLVVVGLGTAAIVVPAHTILQEDTPDDLRGRVISVSLAGLALAQVGGMGTAAWLGRHLPTPQILWIAAGLCLTSTLVLSTALRPRRQPALYPPARDLSRPEDAAIRAGDRG